jgi:hypothetical protein
MNNSPHFPINSRRLTKLRNANQPDALFILNLFRQSTSTCFGNVYCPSSGGIHCICTAIGTCYQIKRVTRTNCCTYAVNIS